MQYDELPVFWQEKIAEYIKEKYNEDRRQLNATDFRHNVMLNLHDGSSVYFKNAFYLLDGEKKEVGIFTEHCGYHIFPFYEAEIELLASEWTDIGN
jgi:hypothetical protein